MFPPRAHEHSPRCWWDHEIAGWVCAPAGTGVDVDVPAQVRRRTEQVAGMTDVTAAQAGEVASLP